MVIMDHPWPSCGACRFPRFYRFESRLDPWAGPSRITDYEQRAALMSEDPLSGDGWSDETVEAGSRTKYERSCVRSIIDAHAGASGSGTVEVG